MYQRLRVPAALAFLTLWQMLCVPVSAQNPVSQPRVTIVAPQASSYLAGKVELHGEVSPADTVSSVSFFVDGRQVCVIAERPYVCFWEAGREVREHQVRFAVTLKDETRLVQNVRTRGLAFADASDVEAVQVTVTVTDNGKFVDNIPRSAFKIWEDEKPQAISSFVSENVPLELLVAVDASSSMMDAMPTVKAAVKDFLEAVPESNRVTVIQFSDTIVPVARRTTDPAERLRAVDRLAAWGATALYDVIAQGVDMLGQEPGRKALVVFTDGEDQGSHITLKDAEERLQASDVTLYMIGQGRGVSAEPLKKVMQQLADPTGGRALFTDSVDKLHAAFEELLQELSHQYLIGYQSTNTARDGKWRALRVELDGRGRVRARRGYLAAAPKR
ncbi:MAG TPA: VWA domain-containing protein [Vicinamibacterales bacterium]|nr:VWA domain-containing protein [Vicinamibacterales bacterium]